ncbi:MAG: hypothetical protein IT379_27470, partial [Deltaproteobacteria bacterium]|nr:hypothetical protein [Deltaproteobacteria bacterium]
HAAVSRLREGELRGGDEGRLLVERATAWMGEQKIRDPIGMAALVAPSPRAGG